jgi:hypothetical protein
VIACLGSWTALDLFRRVRAHTGHRRTRWLLAAAAAMGLSIWAMHFIAMLGFDPGTEVRYDIEEGPTLILEHAACASHGSSGGPCGQALQQGFTTKYKHAAPAYPRPHAVFVPAHRNVQEAGPVHLDTLRDFEPLAVGPT